jgi:hypothetical protein
VLILKKLAKQQNRLRIAPKGEVLTAPQPLAAAQATKENLFRLKGSVGRRQHALLYWGNVPEP